MYYITKNKNNRMSSQINLRFSKYDDYNNPVFIASGTNPKEIQQYTKLSNIYRKLMRFNLDTFLPVYHSSEFHYASIRFKKTLKYSKLKKNDLYAITYDVKQTGDESNKKFINCYLNTVKLLEKAPVVDEGELLDLEAESD